MPLIVTPSRLAEFGEFYHQLGTMMSAGVPVVQVLEHLHRSPPARHFRAPIEQVLGLLTQGHTFSEALARIKDWLPSFDLALIEAGERSGRLDACFRLLANYYSERAQLARKLISELTYPALVLHTALLIFPPGLITGLVWKGEVMPFVLNKLMLFGPFYVGVFLLLYASQGRRGETWRARIERFLHPLPIIGTARRNLALARLSAALEALINAGVSIVNGWELAATASGSPALRRAVAQWRPRLEAGATPAELLRGTTQFPDLFANLYHTGEISGTLDETLRRLHLLYQENASRSLKALAEWMPRLIYIGIMLAVAYQIVSFWIGYFGNVSQILGP